MSYPPQLAYPSLEAPWGQPSFGAIDASPSLWSEFSAPTIAPSALQTRASPLTVAPYELESYIELNLPTIEEPRMAPQPTTSQQIAASSPSSPEGTPSHLSPRTSWSGASSPTPQHQKAACPPNSTSATDTNPAMDTLMQMIAWPAGGARSVAAKKRPRSEHEYTKDKHLMTEKRRREDMSEAIDTIHRIMPESRMDKKLTKVDILQDAAVYFAKLQSVALALIEENAQLRARCQQAAQERGASSSNFGI